MKVLRKRAFKVIAFIFVVLLLLQVVSSILLCTSTSAEMHIKGFYKEPKNTIDVALIGSSEVYADFSSPLAYRDYGFTSYGLCYDGAPASMYSSMLDVYLERQDPQVVVIELNGFFYGKDNMYSEARIRKWTDNMKKDHNWVKVIKQNVDKEERLNYYIPLLKYHSNWSEPSEIAASLYFRIRMHMQDISKMKSFGTKTLCSEKIITKRKDSRPMTEQGREQLYNMLSYCEDNGIENVLFLWSPHLVPMNNDSDEEIRMIVEQHGYKYLNCDKLFDDIGIDKTTDFYNSEHLNVFGNEKFTKYLGEYINENFDMDISHSDKVKKQWQECVSYTEDVYSIMRERTESNEGLPYNEFTDYSDKFHDTMLKNKDSIKLHEEKKSGGSTNA